MGSLPAAGDDAFDLAPASLAIVDADDGTTLRANAALAARLGVEPADIEGAIWPSPLGGTRRDFHELRRAVTGPGRVVVDRRLGERIDAVWWRQTMVLVDQPGEQPYLIVQVEDRTEEHQATVELTRAADHDELTGLWNRRRFRRELREVLADHEQGVGLVLFDVDGFKEVNDTYGHSVGDAALTAVAAALRGAVSGDAGVARLSGDEFAVFLRAPSPEQVADRCRRLAQVTRRVVVGETVPEIELSAGWAVAPTGQNADRKLHDLMVEADVAMYATKARARAERRASFGPDVDEAAVAGVWPTDDVVHERGFELWAHPVALAATGAEALHDVTLRGPQAPVTLGALVRIIEMIERHAGRSAGQPANYLVHLHDFPLGVGSAVKWLGRTAVDAGLAPGSITFALPEARLLEEGRSSRRVLSTVRQEGFGLAVDTFGADVGSLRLLTDLAPDQVWLDHRLLDLASPAAPRAGLDLIELTIAMVQRSGGLTGVSGLAAEHVDTVASLGVDLVLVPDAAALRPVGVVGLGSSLEPISAVAGRQPEEGSTTGS